MNNYQLCPVCGGRGIDPFVTAMPDRISHPCHRCKGEGTILPPGVVQCQECGKVKKIGSLHFCV